MPNHNDENNIISLKIVYSKTETSLKYNSKVFVTVASAFMNIFKILPYGPM